MTAPTSTSKNTKNSKRLVLVGNGDPPRDLSSTIDQADYVIRFNATRNYDKGTGTKVDALCVSAGAVHRKASKGESGLTPLVAQRAGEIWFVPGTWSAQLPHVVLGMYGLQAKTTRVLPIELERSLLEAMRALSTTPLGRPTGSTRHLERFAFREDPAGNVCLASTGLVTLAYVLSLPEFAEHQKCLVGFDWFHGGAAVPNTSSRVHAWEAEKRLCDRYLADALIHVLVE